MAPVDMEITIILQHPNRLGTKVFIVLRHTLYVDLGEGRENTDEAIEKFKN